MGIVKLAKFLGLVLFLAAVAACSGSDAASDGAATDGAASDGGTAGGEIDTPAATVEDDCRSGAQQVVSRLEAFVEGLGDVTPQEFLAQDEVEGIGEFQNDVAEIIATAANQNSTLCNLDGLQVFVDEELAGLEDQSLLSTYLVSAIRFGGSRERSDVSAGPDDDFDAILGLLDNGSSITLRAGTYEFDTSLLIQRDITIVGDGIETTVISSTAADAAIAVFGDGKLTLRDLTVQHVGESSASVVLAFGAGVDIEQVSMSGAVGDEETGGGNGILLSDGVVNEDGTAGDRPADAALVPASRIVNSEITSNAVSGVVVAGVLNPVITGNTISDNGSCGLCFVGQAGGLAQLNTVAGNEFGVQASEESNPRITENIVSGNTAVGMVLLGATTAQVDNNEVHENSEVGIAIQGESSPQLDSNEISDQTVGITVVDAATPTITASLITATDIGMQIAGTAAPIVSDSQLIDTASVGLVHREQSAGSFLNTVMTGEQTVGVLVEGEASPSIEGLSVENAEVSVSYREAGAGQLLNSTFSDPQIAIQLEDQASPLIEGNEILRPEAAGIIIRSDGNVIVRSNTIVDAGLGIGAAGEAKGLLEDNTIMGGDTAFSIIENATSVLTGNTLSGQAVAVQVGDSAAPTIAENEISNATAAAIVFRDEATGTLTRNTIVNPQSVGVQIVDSARPEIADNVLIAGLSITENDVSEDGDEDISEESDEADSGDAETADSEGVETADSGDDSTDENTAQATTDEGAESSDSEGAGTADSEGVETADSGEDSTDENTTQSTTDEGAESSDSTVGILFADATSGSAARNQVFGFVIGVQVSDTAAPEVLDNVVDGGEVNGVGFLYRDSAQGLAEGNRTASHSIGFQISDQASPALTENTVEQVGDVAFLIQGTATPNLEGNSCPIGIPGIAVVEQATPIVGLNRCEAVAG